MQIKICEKCFVCHSIVLCQSCFKCTKCCPQSICRGQTSELLENLARSGRRSKGSSNPQRGLHPPLSDPAKASKVSDRHKLLCQSPEDQLPTGGITSAYRQKCSRDSKKPNISELGLLTATEKQVYLGRLDMRPIQWHLKNNWRVPEALEKIIPVPRSLHPHLEWWLDERNVLQGQPLHPLKHALQIFTDVSKEGWGAHLGQHTARGSWSVPESKLHIN